MYNTPVYESYQMQIYHCFFISITIHSMKKPLIIVSETLGNTFFTNIYHRLFILRVFSSAPEESPIISERNVWKLHFLQNYITIIRKT